MDMFSNSRNTILSQITAEFNRLVNQRMCALLTVFPGEIDFDLSFLDSHVEEALDNGCEEYVTHDERLQIELKQNKQPEKPVALRFDAYQTPSVASAAVTNPLFPSASSVTSPATTTAAVTTTTSPSVISPAAAIQQVDVDDEALFAQKTGTAVWSRGGYSGTPSGTVLGSSNTLSSPKTNNAGLGSQGFGSSSSQQQQHSFEQHSTPIFGHSPNSANAVTPVSTHSPGISPPVDPHNSQPGFVLPPSARPIEQPTSNQAQYSGLFGGPVQQQSSFSSNAMGRRNKRGGRRNRNTRGRTSNSSPSGQQLQSRSAVPVHQTHQPRQQNTTQSFLDIESSPQPMNNIQQPVGATRSIPRSTPQSTNQSASASASNGLDDIFGSSPTPSTVTKSSSPIDLIDDFVQEPVIQRDVNKQSLLDSLAQTSTPTNFDATEMSDLFASAPFQASQKAKPPREQPSTKTPSIVSSPNSLFSAPSTSQTDQSPVTLDEPFVPQLSATPLDGIFTARPGKQPSSSIKTQNYPIPALPNQFKIMLGRKSRSSKSPVVLCDAGGIYLSMFRIFTENHLVCAFFVQNKQPSGSSKSSSVQVEISFPSPTLLVSSVQSAPNNISIQPPTAAKGYLFGIPSLKPGTHATIICNCSFKSFGSTQIAGKLNCLEFSSSFLCDLSFLDFLRAPARSMAPTSFENDWNKKSDISTINIPLEVAPKLSFSSATSFMKNSFHFAPTRLADRVIGGSSHIISKPQILFSLKLEYSKPKICCITVKSNSANSAKMVTEAIGAKFGV